MKKKMRCGEWGPAFFKHNNSYCSRKQSKCNELHLKMQVFGLNTLFSHLDIDFLIQVKINPLYVMKTQGKWFCN